MRIIKIDPYTKTVTEEDIDYEKGKLWEALRKIMNCSFLDTTDIGKKHTLTLDEDGWFKQPQPSAWTLGGAFFCGIACVTGHRIRSNIITQTECTLDLAEIANRVVFDCPAVNPDFLKWEVKALTDEEVRAKFGGAA